MHVDEYLALLSHAEHALADSLKLVSDRHSQDAEIRDMGPVLARWCENHVEALEPFIAKYGRSTAAQPDVLRAALFQQPRIGGLGLLRDLGDLGILAHYVHQCWFMLFQAARALRDEDLKSACESLGGETNRVISWVATHVQTLAPQALTVTAKKSLEVKASVPYDRRLMRQLGGSAVVVGLTLAGLMLAARSQGREGT